MEVIITQWALDSYLDLLYKQKAFTKIEYKNIIRPDVLLLKSFPNATKFKLQQFWCPAECPTGQKITDGFKIKWDSLGSGKIELRLPVALLKNAYLCEAYVKLGSKEEQRKLARFKTHLQLIRQNQHTVRGQLP